jgi:hypothetical protein
VPDSHAPKISPAVSRNNDRQRPDVLNMAPSDYRLGSSASANVLRYTTTVAAIRPLARAQACDHAEEEHCTGHAAVLLSAFDLKRTSVAQFPVCYVERVRCGVLMGGE